LNISQRELDEIYQRETSGSRESALALGNPNLGDETYNLCFAEREVKEISQDYPKSGVFVGDQATKARAISLSPNNDIKLGHYRENPAAVDITPQYRICPRRMGRVRSLCSFRQLAWAL
jgi:hypothetical protein